MGSGEWKTTTEWPPAGFEDRVLFFGPENRLVAAAPADGVDRLTVDFTASTGPGNRWHTNIGGGDVIYPDRREADEKLLVYTGEPLPTAVEITGHPSVALWVRSTHSDGAFFAYLESVAPDGRVTYLTEGQLRAMSRKISKAAPRYHLFGPHRSFRREDAEPLSPGELTELVFELWPTSVRLEAGQRLRVAIAGADADAGTFGRYPASGDPEIAVERGAGAPSRIVVPMRPAK